MPCVSVVAEAPHEMLALGDACESEPMESEMMEYSPFLALSPGHVQEIENVMSSQLYSANDDLRRTLSSRSLVSFGCGLCDDDVLSTAASDLMVESGRSLPPSG